MKKRRLGLRIHLATLLKYSCALFPGASFGQRRVRLRRQRRQLGRVGRRRGHDGAQARQLRRQGRALHHRRRVPAGSLKGRNMSRKMGQD